MQNAGTLKNFIINNEKYTNNTRQAFCKNHNFFDLGFNAFITNDSKLIENIEYLSKSLDLVMILEYYHESIIFEGIWEF